MSALLNKRIEVWGKVKFKNALLETDYTNGKVTTVWASINPQTAIMQKGQVETILSNVTHKIIIRYNSGASILQDNWIIFGTHRFDINYILNPYENNKMLELFCTEVIG